MNNNIFFIFLTFGVLYWIVRIIRFVSQSLWYRRLDENQKGILVQKDPMWHEFHGRSPSKEQLILYILTAIGVFAWLACRDLGIF